MLQACIIHRNGNTFLMWAETKMYKKHNKKYHIQKSVEKILCQILFGRFGCALLDRFIRSLSSYVRFVFKYIVNSACTHLWIYFLPLFAGPRFFVSTPSPPSFSRFLCISFYLSISPPPFFALSSPLSPSLSLFLFLSSFFSLSLILSRSIPFCLRFVRNWNKTHSRKIREAQENARDRTLPFQNCFY